MALGSMELYSQEHEAPHVLMPKECKDTGCSYNVWGGGYCKNHQFLRKKPSKLKSTSFLKRKPLNKISSKQQKLNTAYSVLRKQYLKDHPVCEHCIEMYPDQDRRHLKAIEIHHTAYRGKNTNDTSTWLAVARKCHNWIHANPKEARERGFLK